MRSLHGFVVSGNLRNALQYFLVVSQGHLQSPENIRDTLQNFHTNSAGRYQNPGSRSSVASPLFNAPPSSNTQHLQRWRIQRRLAWPLCKDDTHKSRAVDVIISATLKWRAPTEDKRACKEIADVYFNVEIHSRRPSARNTQTPQPRNNTHTHSTHTWHNNTTHNKTHKTSTKQRQQQQHNTLNHNYNTTNHIRQRGEEKPQPRSGGSGDAKWGPETLLRKSALGPRAGPWNPRPWTLSPKP